MSGDYALLSKKVQGHKELVGSHYPLSYENINVPVGSLLEHLSSAYISEIKTAYKFEVNYAVYSSSSHDQSGVLLLASSDQLHKLTARQKDLLLAVDLIADRVEVLQKLNWVEYLVEGYEVYTTIDTIPVPVKGVIRFVGELSGADGIRFGIELMDKRGKGNSDGSYQGERHFTCDRKCGVFVSMDMLTSYKAADAAKPISNKPGPLKIKPPVRIGYYVTFNDVHGHKHGGLVRWIGTDKSVLPDGSTIVGIETEQYLDVTEIPHHITMAPEKDYVVEHGSKVFLPVQCVDLKDFKIQDGKDNITTDSSNDYQNSLNISFDDTFNKENLTSLRHNDHSSGSNIASNQNPHNLTKGSVVEYLGNYGEIKWIGTLPNIENRMAGLEMDNKELGKKTTDGLWKGVKYFSCAPRRGIFVALKELQPCFLPRNKLSEGNLSNSAESLDDENMSTPLGESPRSLPSSPLRELSSPHNLEIGSAIYYGDPPKNGVIKWIGTIPPRDSVLYAGVEMNEKSAHATDGKWAGIRYFKCRRGRGKFVPLSQLKRLEGVEVGTSVQTGSDQRGVVKKLRDFFKHSDSEIKVDSGCRKISPSQLSPEQRPPDPQPIQYKFEVGSAVQHGTQYGVIRQIMMCQRDGVERAQVELDAGVYREIPLSQLQPDDRFSNDVNDTQGKTNPLQKMVYIHEEKLPIVPSAKFDERKHTGIKGIQGNKNSCYLDAILYGLFAFSDAFDFVFLDLATTDDEQYIQVLLKNKIVYPLRVKGIVIQDSITVFRGILANLQKIKGFTSDEKDPEELLNVLFKHVLHLEPFVNIRRPSGIDNEFLIQLFVEPIEGISVLHTQHLLTKMFLEQYISFIKYPSRLLLQMPRHGKKFKSFRRIIPSLELDIEELCETNKEGGPCFMCSHPSSCVCNECNNEPNLQINKKLYFCEKCSFLWHNHHNRQGHTPCQLKPAVPGNEFDTGKLQLLSVLCIETSHYVCFTRVTENDWVFFDSMAERQDNGFNLPKVTVCTQLLQEHVYGEKDISGVPSKSLPELVRRFVEDVYMCIYVDPDGVMYQ